MNYFSRSCIILADFYSFTSRWKFGKLKFEKKDVDVWLLFYSNRYYSSNTYDIKRRVLWLSLFKTVENVISILYHVLKFLIEHYNKRKTLKRGFYKTMFFNARFSRIVLLNKLRMNYQNYSLLASQSSWWQYNRNRRALSYIELTSETMKK